MQSGASETVSNASRFASIAYPKSSSRFPHRQIGHEHMARRVGNHLRNAAGYRCCLRGNAARPEYRRVLRWYGVRFAPIHMVQIFDTDRIWVAHMHRSTVTTTETRRDFRDSRQQPIGYRSHADDQITLERSRLNTWDRGNVLRRERFLIQEMRQRDL